MTPKDESPRSELVQYAIGEERRRITNSPRMNEAAGPKQMQHSVVDVSGDESKILCCKEQYWIGIWNVRSMTQGKVDVVKQEMIRINISILGISKLKWAGMVKFNWDGCFIYYCGQESHRWNGVALIIIKSPKYSTWFNPQNNRMILVHFQGKPFNITVIQIYAHTTDAGEAEVDQFCEDLEDLLELTPKKDVLFIIGDWNAQVWSQDILGITGKFALGEQNEARQRLTEFCQENALVIANAPFQQHKRRLYTWTSPNGQYRNQIDYVLCSLRWRVVYSQQKQNLELTVAQFISLLWQN